MARITDEDVAKVTHALVLRTHPTVPARAKYVLAQLSSTGGAPFPFTVAELVDAFVQAVCCYALPHDGALHTLHLIGRGTYTCQWLGTDAAGRTSQCGDSFMCSVCFTEHACGVCGMLYCAKHTGTLKCQSCGSTFADYPDTCTGCTLRHVRDRHARRCCVLTRSVYHASNVLCCNCAVRDTVCCMCDEVTCDRCATRVCSGCDAPLQFCEAHSEQLLTCVESVDHCIGTLCDECSSWVCRCGRRWCAHCHPDERCPTCFGRRKPLRKRKPRDSVEGLEITLAAAAPGPAEPKNSPSRKK